MDIFYFYSFVIALFFGDYCPQSQLLPNFADFFYASAKTSFFELQMSPNVAVERDVLIYFDNFFFESLFVKFDFDLRFVVNTAKSNF